MTNPLEFLEENCLDLRCVSVPTGGDDFDVAWVVIEHHMTPPREREISYGRTPQKAIEGAMWYLK